MGYEGEWERRERERDGHGRAGERERGEYDRHCRSRALRRRPSSRSPPPRSVRFEHDRRDDGRGRELRERDTHRLEGRRREGRGKGEEEEEEDNTDVQLLEDAACEEDRLIEERRKRRAAIMAKYKQAAVSEGGNKHEVQAQPVVQQPAAMPAAPAAPAAQQQQQRTVPTLIAAPADLSKAPGAAESEDDEDDMFADDFDDKALQARDEAAAGGVEGLKDAWDDAEGYYNFRVNEVLHGRYEVYSNFGRGVFSTVLRARDLQAAPGSAFPEVAIKVIRANEQMRKAAQLEVAIVRKLAGADPENRRHCVRLLSHFEHREHVCMVFEPLALNLREVLKKFGRNIGLNLGAVRAYAQQLLIALKHIYNCGVLHADLKPDNVLVNAGHNLLKVRC